MADLLRTGTEWLATQLQAHAGTTATYRRGLLSCALTVTIGQSSFTREDGEGLKTARRMVDFLFPAEDLILDDEQVEPEPGDRIEVTGLGTFELFAPGGEEGAWRFSDPHRVILRVHGEEVLP
jgi:hypothetical protein